MIASRNVAVGYQIYELTNSALHLGLIEVPVTA